MQLVHSGCNDYPQCFAASLEPTEILNENITQSVQLKSSLITGDQFFNMWKIKNWSCWIPKSWSHVLFQICAFVLDRRVNTFSASVYKAITSIEFILYSMTFMLSHLFHSIRGLKTLPIHCASLAIISNRCPKSLKDSLVDNFIHIIIPVIILHPHIVAFVLQLFWNVVKTSLWMENRHTEN